MRTLLMPMLLILLTGCAAAGVPFTPETHTGGNKVVVYVYRPSLAVNCCVAPYIFINGEKQSQLKNGGYLLFILDPGPISLEAVNEAVGFKPLRVAMYGEPGQSYYVRWAPAAMMGWNPSKDASEKAPRMKQEGIFVSTDEAKKRAQEQSQGTLANVQRATDTDSTVDKNAVARERSFFAIEHERELRVMDSTTALKEIALTRKSE